MQLGQGVATDLTVYMRELELKITSIKVITDG